MNCDGVEFVGGDAGGITIWAGAEEAGSKEKSKSKASDRSVRSTRADSTSALGKLTPKQLGEIAEAEFIAKAVGMGFVVAKPWGDSEPYDFIVNPKKSFIFWRVQVKSAHTIGADGGCSFRAHDHNMQSYSSEDIDALVAYARPMNAWNSGIDTSAIQSNMPRFGGSPVSPAVSYREPPRSSTRSA